MLCSKLHYQKGFDLIIFSYKILSRPQVGILTGHEKEILSVAISADGTRAASSSVNPQP